jgi:hypothetical protein
MPSFAAVTVTVLAISQVDGSKTSWLMLSLGTAEGALTLGADTDSVIVTADVGAVASLTE